MHIQHLNVQIIIGGTRDPTYARLNANHIEHTVVEMISVFGLLLCAVITYTQK